ncbi:unnamed protein product [Echinostoma caproni]|uniref:PK_Tyr_Ser-Thr domain-containing protein n=1 Tax=Echinostoma caproni TaxID=27848 RepID=A0A183BFZ9_9TREM|nr:unnamed protein product [Echinostoma caproni]
MFEKIKPDVDVFIEKNRKERCERPDDLLRAIKHLCFRFSPKDDQERFEVLVRRVMYSIESAKPETSYLALALRKATLVEWIRVTKWIFSTILHFLADLDVSTCI